MYRRAPEYPLALMPPTQHSDRSSLRTNSVLKCWDGLKGRAPISADQSALPRAQSRFHRSAHERSTPSQAKRLSLSQPSYSRMPWHSRKRLHSHTAIGLRNRGWPGRHSLRLREVLPRLRSGEIQLQVRSDSAAARSAVHRRSNPCHAASSWRVQCAHVPQ
jgi:hypothetical protein